MIHRLRTLRRQARDSGYTMTEMIVVVGILGVVLAAVQTTLIMTSHTVGDNGLRIDQTNRAKVAIESMSRVLRTAVLPSQLNASGTTSSAAAFIQGTATSVQFYADLNNDSNIVGPSRVTYNVDVSGALTETIQAPDAHAVGNYNYTYCTPGPGCVINTRVLARGMQTGGTNPALFTYYDKNGNAITSTTLSAAELASVDSMDLVVTVKASAKQDIHASTLTLRVSLPNADSVALPTSSP